MGTTASGNVLANDADPDHDVLGLLGTLGQPIAGAFGSLIFQTDGSYIYSTFSNAVLPSSGVAQDTFAYVESDGHGGTAQATLTVSVTSSNQNYVLGRPGTTTNLANGQGVIDGSLGAQTLGGGNAHDVLIAGPGDVLTGGNGPDVFVFRGNFGMNTITDFGSSDLLELDKTHFANANDVLAHTVFDSTSGSMVITDIGHGIITLGHLQHLTSHDFVLM
jgi:VCBS repeat-containing protein